jgi:hypothetical protein
MKFALLVASASAAATIETFFACTKADDCKTTTDACCDAKAPATVTAEELKITTAAKVCLPKGTSWSQKWTTAPTGTTLTEVQKWVVASGATPVTDKTYKADLTCMAAGAKALSAAAVLAASYYMA